MTAPVSDSSRKVLLDWSEIPDDSSGGAKQRGRRPALLCRQAVLVRVPARQANSLHPPRTAQQPQACSTGRTSLHDGSHAKQREEAGGILCRQRSRPDRQNSLHPPRTQAKPQACSTGQRSLTAPVQNTDTKVRRWQRQHRTEEQPQACSTGRTSLTAPVQSRERRKAVASVGKQLLRVPARQAKQFASASHRRAAASLLDWSEIRDGSRAEQRGRKEGSP